MTIAPAPFSEGAVSMECPIERRCFMTNLRERLSRAIFRFFDHWLFKPIEMEVRKWTH